MKLERPLQPRAEPGAPLRAFFATSLPPSMRDLLMRYGVAVALAGLALLLRSVLPFREGTSIYQLPIAAVVLSAWYGGRGPGLVASLICVMGASYLFVPPVHSFETSPEHVLPLAIFVTLCLLLTEFSAGHRRAEHALRARDEELKRAEAERREHVRFLESMDRVNRAIQSTNDLDQMLGRALDEVFDIFQCDRAVLGRHSGESETASFTRLAKRERPGFVLDLNLGVEVAADEGLTAMSAGLKAARGPVQWVLGSIPPRIAQHLERVGVQSVLSMPIEPKTERPDYFYVFTLRQCTYPRVWTPEEERLFLEIGRRLGDATTILSTLGGLRESERRLEEAQRVAHLGYWDRDLVANRFVLSEESWRIFGVEPHERPADLAEWTRRWQAFIYPDDRPRVLAAVHAALAGGPRYDVEFRIIRKSGQVRVIHSQGDVSRDASGRAVRMFGTQQDVTALRESEQRLQAAQRLAHVGWWERDYDAGRVSLSDEACRIFGVQPVDLPNWHGRWLNLIHPDDRARAAGASEAALGGGPRYDVEYRVVRPDGTLRVVHSQGDVTRDESGRPVRQFGVMQDITELRRAEDDLRASEARFRTFVDRATDAFFLLDEELNVVDVNRQACEDLGLGREELIGLHPGDFDVALDASSITRLAERAGAGEVVTFETRHRRKDGTVFPVEIRVATFRQEGNLFYLALARDISERKRAEESLRESEAYLTEAQRLSHTGSWALDVATNRYVYTSVEFDRIFGFDPLGEALTREAVLERMHPEDRISWKRILEKSVREKLDTTSQYRIVLPDGSVRHIQTIRHPVVNSAGEVVKLVGTSIDITQRKHAEEERERLRRLEVELAHANRVKALGELTTSIVHEVSQPLGAMIASAAAGARWLAAEPPNMAEARATLDNVAADGKRAREVITRIRSLMKRQVARVELLDVNLKIQEVLALTEHELRSHHIAPRTELDTALPRVAGDRVQLQQVILNLVLNAMDAMSGIQDRPRELTIISRRDGSKAVLVEVRDSGTGLDAEKAEAVFEAFYTTKAEGLGIGLSISRSIVEAHGGRLWASPNEPHGAIFRFSLPVADAGQS